MSIFLIRSATSHSSSYPIVLTRLCGPRSRPNPHLKCVEVPGIEPATPWTVVRHANVILVFLITIFTIFEPTGTYAQRFLSCVPSSHKWLTSILIAQYVRLLYFIFGIVRNNNKKMFLRNVIKIKLFSRYTVRGIYLQFGTHCDLEHGHSCRRDVVLELSSCICTERETSESRDLPDWRSLRPHEPWSNTQSITGTIRPWVHCCPSYFEPISISVLKTCDPLTSNSSPKLTSYNWNGKVNN